VPVREQEPETVQAGVSQRGEQEPGTVQEQVPALEEEPQQVQALGPERDKAQVPARELEAEGRPRGQALELGPDKVQALERQRALGRDTVQKLCREGPAAESRIDGASVFDGVRVKVKCRVQ